MMNFAVPADRTALAVVAANCLRDGDKIEPPWIVHADGTRDRLLVTVGGVRVWETRLDDVAALERLYVRCVGCQGATWERVRSVVARVAAVGGIAHAEPRHWHGSPGMWWEWHIGPDGFDFEWVKRPTEPLHTDLGAELYASYRYFYYTVMARTTRARAVLVEAMSREVRRRGLKAGLLRLTINGHDYLWRSVCNRWGVEVMEPWRFYGDGEAGSAYAEVAL